ncbi:MAG: hypothetical protein KGI86_13110, partial [Betaproteobacteria bacterium]|nr:hypothetical protein [Betaproteobacteria bacterium]
RPAGEGAQKTSSQAATGPKCPSCKKPTFKSETKTGKAYYRCGVCKGAWWPDRREEGKLGGKWEEWT